MCMRVCACIHVVCVLKSENPCLVTNLTKYQQII